MSTIRNDGGTIKSGIGGAASGTVHTSGNDISSGFGAAPSGTVNVGADISSGMYGPSHGVSSMSLNSGDTLVVKSVTYCYESVISKSSGEAEIFLLSKDGKNCVFKLYYPNFKPKDDILKQLALLNHEDIINVLDYGYHHDRFFEIMEYAEGGTLEQYLPIKDAGRIKQIVKETVNAYLYCHNHNIIHKDIKPQNLYFKNADGTDLLIGDFGISSLLETGMSRHLTSQSLTVGYAAPEMYGLGGKVYVGKEVDYYALGITLIHLWEGKSPFDGLGIHAISNLTTSGKINIPDDMPKDIQKLVKGLITVDYTKRWAYDEVQRWLRGEDVPVHFHVKEISYPPYQFSTSEAASTAEELAGFLEKSPDKGKKQLYSNKISAWVNLFNQGLSAELDRIIEDDYPKDQDAGIQKAIYLLNPDVPFIQGFVESRVTQIHRIYRTAEEIADALEVGFVHYSKELSSPNHPFYLYLEAHEAKKEADTFRKYFNTFSANKALNTIILEMQGREILKWKKENFYKPYELLDAENLSEIVAVLQDKESKVSLWLDGIPSMESKVDKWRNDGRCNVVTVTYPLEDRSPFYFPDTTKVYNTGEFKVQLEKQLAVSGFRSIATKSGSDFILEADFWLNKYHQSDYDKELLALLKDGLKSPISDDLYMYFQRSEISTQFYCDTIVPLIDQAYSNKSYNNKSISEDAYHKHKVHLIKRFEKAIGLAGSAVASAVSTTVSELNILVFLQSSNSPYSDELFNCFMQASVPTIYYKDTIVPLIEKAYSNKEITEDTYRKGKQYLLSRMENEIKNATKQADKENLIAELEKVASGHPLLSEIDSKIKAKEFEIDEHNAKINFNISKFNIAKTLYIILSIIILISLMMCLYENYIISNGDFTKYIIYPTKFASSRSVNILVIAASILILASIWIYSKNKYLNNVSAINFGDDVKKNIYNNCISEVISNKKTSEYLQWFETWLTSPDFTKIKHQKQSTSIHNSYLPFVMTQIIAAVLVLSPIILLKINTYSKVKSIMQSAAKLSGVGKVLFEDNFKSNKGWDQLHPLNCYVGKGGYVAMLSSAKVRLIEFDPGILVESFNKTTSNPDEYFGVIAANNTSQYSNFCYQIKIRINNNSSGYAGITFANSDDSRIERKYPLIIFQNITDNKIRSYYSLLINNKGEFLLSKNKLNKNIRRAMFYHDESGKFKLDNVLGKYYPSYNKDIIFSGKIDIDSNYPINVKLIVNNKTNVITAFANNKLLCSFYNNEFTNSNIGLTAEHNVDAVFSDVTIRELI